MGASATGSKTGSMIIYYFRKKYKKATKFSALLLRVTPEDYQMYHKQEA